MGWSHGVVRTRFHFLVFPALQFEFHIDGRGIGRHTNSKRRPLPERLVLRSHTAIERFSQVSEANRIDIINRGGFPCWYPVSGGSPVTSKTSRTLLLT